MFLALLSLIAMLFGGHPQRASYVFGAAFVVALTGLVLAISSIRGAKRAATRRPRGSALGVTFAAILTVLSGFMLTAVLLFGPQYTQYVNCLNSAGSSTAAQNACQTDLDNSITTAILGSSSK